MTEFYSADDPRGSLDPGLVHELDRHGVKIYADKKGRPDRIGAGAYADVYRGTKEGSGDVAVKVAELGREIRSLIDLQTLVSVVPRKWRGHVCKVFDHFSVERDDDSPLHVAVVEMLEPTGEEFKLENWHGDETGGERLGAIHSMINDDPTLLADLLDAAAGDVVSDHDPIEWATTVSEIVPQIEKIIREFDPDTEKWDLDLPAIRDACVSGLQRSGLETSDSDKISRRFTSEIVTLFDKGVTFPSSPARTSRTMKRRFGPGKMGHRTDLRVKDLLRFLEYLRDEGIVEWDDLHADNVMVRPSTGELVLSDPGLFRWKV